MFIQGSSFIIFLGIEVSCVGGHGLLHAQVVLLHILVEVHFLALRVFHLCEKLDFLHAFLLFHDLQVFLAAETLPSCLHVLLHLHLCLR